MKSISNRPTACWSTCCATGTPQPIINRLHVEPVKIINRPEVKKLFLARGMEAEGNTPQEFAATVKEEVAKWKKLVVTAGIKSR